MIARIVIEGLGPHKRTDLELGPKGWTTIEGPSQSGKSTLLDAVAFALGGLNRRGKPLPVEVISGEVARVELTLSSGLAIGRQMTNKRRTKRWRQSKGAEVVTYGTEKAFDHAMGVLARRADAIRLVMMPMSWVPLAGGAQGGRPLRDALAGMMPDGDVRGVVASLMGGELRDDDSDTAEGAEAQRRDAGRAVDRADSAFDTRAAVRAQAEAAVPVPVDADDLSKARALQERSRKWETYDEAVQRRKHTVGRIEAAREAAVRWDERAAELSEPTEPPEEPSIAEQHAARQALAHAAAWATWQEQLATHAADTERHATAIAAAEAWSQAVAALGDPPMPLPENCVACGQALPTPKTDEMTAWDAAFIALGHAPTVPPTPTAPDEPSHPRQTAEAVTAAEAVMVKVGAARVAKEQHAAATRAYLRGYRALGQRPEAPALPPEVAPPAGPRLTPEETEWAGQTLRAASVHDAVAASYEGTVTHAVEQEAKARAALEAARAELTRCEALVVACRRAPSIDLERQLEVFGDLGPVGFEFGAKGGVSVTFDGRPWWLASRGRQVCCDLVIRAAFRRALKLSWLPILVDDATAWTGDWPDVAGPVVLLETRDTDGLRVAAKESA